MATKARPSPRRPLRERRVQRQIIRAWGRLLRSERLAKGLTQVQLGHAAGINGLVISAWEAGSALPSAAEFAQLRKVLKKMSPPPDVAALTASIVPAMAARPPKGLTLPPATGPHADFANRLRLARSSAGLTRAQLAAIAKVSPGSIANWESGGHLPQHAPLQRLREVLAQHWGTPAQAKSLAAWEAGAPKVSGRLLRRRGAVGELTLLREKTAGVPGAHAFLLRFLSAVEEGRLSGQRVGLLNSLLRQFEPPDRPAKRGSKSDHKGGVALRAAA